jgi:hypothetical protein
MINQTEKENYLSLDTVDKNKTEPQGDSVSSFLRAGN